MAVQRNRNGDGRLRIVVAGYIVRGPLGGMAWHHLQYVMGLVALGHDVYFVEDSDDYPACYDPQRHVTDVDPSYGLAFAGHAFTRLGMGERWVYHDAHTGRWLGPAAERANEVCRTADLLLNLSGVNPMRPWLQSIPVRVLVDTDPVFTQVRHLTDPAARALALEHTAFFSFGENIGTGRGTVPDDGLPWRPTRQPVVLDAWPVTPAPEDGPFTTVMQWDSYATREHRGQVYGMKSAAFTSYLPLPARVCSPLELAIGGATAPREALLDHGWRLRDPLAITQDPWTYQEYLQGSKGELAIAKHGYASTRCGWFSERSAAYLASGRPVVVQETGFSDWLAGGAGVLPFTSPEEAVAALAEVNGRYAAHCRAAREVAAEYFAASQVLTSLLERATDRANVVGGAPRSG